MERWRLGTNSFPWQPLVELQSREAPGRILRTRKVFQVAAGSNASRIERRIRHPREDVTLPPGPERKPQCHSLATRLTEASVMSTAMMKITAGSGRTALKRRGNFFREAGFMWWFRFNCTISSTI